MNKYFYLSVIFSLVSCHIHAVENGVGQTIRINIGAVNANMRNQNGQLMNLDQWRRLQAPRTAAELAIRHAQPVHPQLQAAPQQNQNNQHN